MLKKIAIVGKPNVGKSTIFNRLSKSKISITQHVPGVTRDRIEAEVKMKNASFLLIDTGGLTFTNTKKNQIEIDAATQSNIAIKEADIILFVVDGSTELTDDDFKVAGLLKKSNKLIYLLVNKSDRFTKNPEIIHNFHALGFENLFAVSAEHNRGFDDILQSLKPHVKDSAVGDEHKIRIAVIGRPNAGKSSLVNAILGEERSIVSEEAGTTRDVVSSLFKFNKRTLELLDTAGIRKKARVDEDIEYYSVIRAIKSIRDADVVVLLLDRMEGAKEQDQKIAGLASDAHKPVIIAVNKVDLGKLTEDDKEDIKEKLKFLHAPVMPISAKNKDGIHKLITKVVEMYDANNTKISTSALNDVLRELVISHAPTVRKGKTIRVTYITQVSISPPTFILLCNYPELLHFSYVKRIEKGLRHAFKLDGINVRIRVKKQP